MRNIHSSLICCAMAWLLCFSTSVVGQTPITVLVIVDYEKAYQSNLLQRIRQLTQDENEDASEIILQAIPKSKLNDKTIEKYKPDLLLSLGTEDSNQIARLNSPLPVLHALITKNQVAQVIPCWPNCPTEQSVQRILLLDQPIERQLRLAKLVFPDAETIGLLTSKISIDQQQQLSRTARSMSLELDFELTATRLLGSQIETLAQRVDLILALADPDVYNASTIPEILLTSYRHRVPVLGFSKSFVRAGAIASAITTLDQFAQQIVEILRDPDAFDEASPQLIYPAYFEVITNRNVARSLNLRFASDTHLHAEIMNHELAD